MTNETFKNYRIFFMNLCLPLGTQASNGGNVSLASHATNIQCLAYLADMEQTE